MATDPANIKLTFTHDTVRKRLTVSAVDATEIDPAVFICSRLPNGYDLFLRVASVGDLDSITTTPVGKYPKIYRATTAAMPVTHQNAYALAGDLKQRVLALCQTYDRGTNPEVWGGWVDT